MMWLFFTIACLICSTEKCNASPEVFMDVGEIVRYHGYPYEEHEIVTDDGYYLTIQRIPHGRDNSGSSSTSHDAETQGSSMFCVCFIAFSSIPELDRKIKMFFALAPITTSSNMKSPLVRVFDLPESLVKFILGHILVFDKGEILQQVTSRLCGYTFFKSFCSLVLYLPGGFTDSLNVSRVDVYLSRYPDSTSVKNMLHWRQLYQTGEFKYYDYGSDNVLHYNQSTPPFYELENMKAPLAAWYGGKDWISAPEDVNITLPRITNMVYKKYIPEFVHFDFLWGMQAYEHVYKEILELMKKNA